jgi:pyrroloquinoline-quinone synthase
MDVSLRERLLGVMDRKNHWAWSKFAAGEIPLPRLRVHFQQEWATYVRDFPIMLARILGHGPPADVRAALAANIYEEQTGGISGSAPHPELFLRMMEGCGYTRADFDRVELLAESATYRAYLDDVTFRAPWIVGCAVLTIFVEGSVNDRGEIAAATHAIADEEPEIERAIAQHPLVRVHKVPPSAMELTRVHRRVEGGHRHDAWDSVLGHASPAEADGIVSAVEKALGLWLAYRDAVARACGLSTNEARILVG